MYKHGSQNWTAGYFMKTATSKFCEGFWKMETRGSFPKKILNLDLNFFQKASTEGCFNFRIFKP